MHLKRQVVDKKWPIQRKGTKYVVAPSRSKKQGVPVLIILRDILKIAKTRKEAKYLINNKEVFLNNKFVKKDNTTMTLFDTLSIKTLNKSYSLNISPQGRFKLEEVAKDAKEKICKVVNKKVIKKALTQINLNDGNNILTKNKIKVGDSIILDLENKSIIEHLPLKKGAKVLIVSGKHTGKNGEIKEIEEKKRLFIVEIGDKKIEMNTKNLIVVK